MSIITVIFATLVAAEFFFIMYLETFATGSAKTSAVFEMDVEELERPSVHVLFQNQGVYNGLLAVLILLAVYCFRDRAWTAIFMVYILLVAVYGGVTSNPKIILKQGGLAALTLVSCLLH